MIALPGRFEAGLVLKSHKAPTNWPGALVPCQVLANTSPKAVRANTKTPGSHLARANVQVQGMLSKPTGVMSMRQEAEAVSGS